ncbi:right-handed parallel beta-helix repeat-containing protein [Micromonospora sp. WMMC241]|uniref:right-handed parallel beta-helix repeat-containing protein n=1 Tax=Micromonospora sp. WMMC241 TaxID=3015159 RepID=UPI0022B5F9FE|nr:right-handed parallel beta-helix repeat-containing protein [Micromonospora sp. WMMC241]MCZ7436760.1 right-handed parallel beta-helix repeat-containing protein [Micromonospora sp. WMMC241]
MKRMLTVMLTAALASTLVVSAAAVPASALVVLPFVVVTAADAGAGSLRDAIVQANANPGPDTIEFRIPGGGVQVITLAANLPSITDSVKIRGYTQPGAAQAGPGTPAALRIVLDASNVAFGLDLRADDSLIAGLVIRGAAGPVAGASCANDGLCVAGADNVIRGNYIGVGYAGMNPLGNNGGGIEVEGDGNTIGGPAPEDRNVISANRDSGIAISGGHNLVQGNVIGLNAAGLAALGNDTGVEITGDGNTIAANVISGNVFDGVEVDRLGSTNVLEGNLIGVALNGLVPIGNGDDGVDIDSGSDNRVGGSTTDARNVISANGGDGVRLDSNGHRVEGNYIGLGVDGFTALGNAGHGVLVHGDAHVIGGLTEGSGNVISANRGAGVFLETDADEIKVLGNTIGTDALLAVNRGNGASGVLANGSGNTIGSTDPNAPPNVIAYNNGDGVTVQVPAGFSSNALARNSIYANTGLGIDLNPNGVTANDALDVDLGANGLQNYPRVTSATTVAGVTTVSWSLNSQVSSQFRIELFASGACDGSGHGEGRVFLGDTVVTTNAAGNISGNTPTAVPAAVGQLVVATATLLTAGAAADATSEFSACVAVV